MEEPLGDDERETFGLEPEEAQNIRADLEDLEGMRRTFQAQGVKGVVIVCERCEENHYYEWELLVENLEHMLQTGESQMHEPAFEGREEEDIQWDYGKGYVDALANANANALAREIADKHARDFICGKDKPVVLGKVTPGEDFFHTTP